MKKKQIHTKAEQQEQPEEATPATTPAEQDQKEDRSEQTRRKKPVAVRTLQQDSVLGHEGIEDLEEEATPATTPAEQDQKEDRSEQTRRKKPAAVPPLQQDSVLGHEGIEDLESESQKQDDDERLSIPDVLPVLPLKDIVIYPYAVQPLGVGQERSIRLIDDVMRGDRLVVLVAQKSAETEQAGPDDIYKIVTVSRVARMIRMPDGTIQVIVQGLERVDIGEFTQEKPDPAARAAPKPDSQGEDKRTE